MADDLKKDEGTPVDEPSATDIADDVTSEPGDTPEPQEPGKEPREGRDTEPKAEPSADEPVYQVGKITFTEKELNEAWDRHQNYKKWDATHHKRGLDLNRQEQALKERQEFYESKVKDAEFYGQAKTLLEANPKALAYVQQLVNEGGGDVSPKLKALEDKFDARERTLQTKEAIADLKAERPDFDYGPVKGYLDEVNWDNPKEVIAFQHNAFLGRNLDQIVQQKVAQALSKGGSPRPAPLKASSGTTPAQPVNVFESDQDELTAIMEDLKSGNLG